MPKTKATKTLTNYTHVEKNIYKTGTRYRVRVGRFSVNTGTLKQARIQKALLKQTMFV